MECILPIFCICVAAVKIPLSEIWSQTIQTQQVRASVNLRQRLLLKRLSGSAVWGLSVVFWRVRLNVKVSCTADLFWLHVWISRSFFIPNVKLLWFLAYWATSGESRAPLTWNYGAIWPQFSILSVFHALQLGRVTVTRSCRLRPTSLSWTWPSVTSSWPSHSRPSSSSTPFTRVGFSAKQVP